MVVPALLVAIIVVVGLLALGLGANHNAATHHPATTTPHHQTQRRHHAAPQTSTAATRLSSHAPASATAPRHVHAPAGPVPPGFGAESFTAIGTGTGGCWGARRARTPPCTSIVRTDNGGHSFVGTPAPRTTQVSQLRFANAADGFAYDSQLWVTHDAGATWHQVRLGGAVTELATAGGFAYALVRYGHKGAGRLERAPLGSDTWTTLAGAGSAYAGLWVHGPDVLVGSDDGATLQISHNSGVELHPGGVAVEGTARVTSRNRPPASCGPTAPPGPRAPPGARRTPGAHFQPVHGPAQPNSALFAAATSTTAVLGADKLFRTTDGGAHYATVTSVGAVTAWQYLGFTDATHGVAIGYVGSSPTPGDERLYYSSDAGATYHLVSIG